MTSRQYAVAATLKSLQEQSLLCFLALIWYYMLSFRRKMFDLLLITRRRSTMIFLALTLENSSTLLFLLLFFRHNRCVQKRCTKFCTDF